MGGLYQSIGARGIMPMECAEVGVLPQAVPYRAFSPSKALEMKCSISSRFTKKGPEPGTCTPYLYMLGAIPNQTDHQQKILRPSVHC